MNARKLGIWAVFSATVTIAVAYASAFLAGGAPAWAPWLLILGIATMVVGTMIVGASRRGSVGVLAVPFAGVFVILVGGFGVALRLGNPQPGGPLWLGLPPGAAVVLYGVGLLPLLFLPLAYALTFDKSALSEADLDRIREQARALREGTPQPAERVEVGV